MSVAAPGRAPQFFREVGIDMAIRQIKSGRDAEAVAADQQHVRETVEQLIADIRARGDAAVRHYSQTFDGWSPASFRLSDADIQSCVDSMSASDIADIEFAQTQIRNFALEQRAALREHT